MPWRRQAGPGEGQRHYHVVMLPGGCRIPRHPAWKWFTFKGLQLANERWIVRNGDVAALEGQCQFRDCAHTKTKGCAIEAAVEAGTIDKARYENFIRMRQETAANERAVREKDWKNK